MNSWHNSHFLELFVNSDKGRVARDSKTIGFTHYFYRTDQPNFTGFMTGIGSQEVITTRDRVLTTGEIYPIDFSFNRVPPDPTNFLVTITSNFSSYRVLTYFRPRDVTTCLIVGVPDWDRISYLMDLDSTEHLEVTTVYFSTGDYLFRSDTVTFIRVDFRRLDMSLLLMKDNVCIIWT